MGCMVLCRAFHTAPEQGQGLTPIAPHYSGSNLDPCPGTGHSQCDYTSMRPSLLFNGIISDLETIFENTVIRIGS